MTRPLRVLFVAGSLGGGGAERQLVELLQHLDRGRIAPRLYLSYRRGELLPEVPSDVPIEAFWDGTSQRRWEQRLLAKCRCPCAARAAHLREVIRRNPIDVIMSWSLMCGYEVTLATWGRPPHVTYVVCQPAAELDDVFPPGFPARYALARWVYRSAALVLANSQTLRSGVEAFYRMPSTRTSVLYNYRDFSRIDRLADAAAPPWPRPGRWIIAVGRLHADKGFDILLEAMQQLRRDVPLAELAILGQGPDEAALRDQARRLGISEHVHFLGFQANPYPYFRAADAFVLSSRREGMPGVLIEALACRTPVVAADCPTGPREILEEGRFGPLAPVGDAAALARAIRQVLESPPSPEKREEARRAMLERFDISLCRQTLENVLCDVAHVRSSQRESRS